MSVHPAQGGLFTDPRSATHHHLHLAYWKKNSHNATLSLFKMRCYLTHGYERLNVLSIRTHSAAMLQRLRGCRLMTKTHRQTWTNEWRTQQYMCVRFVIGFISKARLLKIPKKVLIENRLAVNHRPQHCWSHAHALLHHQQVKRWWFSAEKIGTHPSRATETVIGLFAQVFIYLSWKLLLPQTSLLTVSRWNYFPEKNSPHDCWDLWIVRTNCDIISGKISEFIQFMFSGLRTPQMRFHSPPLYWGWCMSKHERKKPKRSYEDEQTSHRSAFFVSLLRRLWQMNAVSWIKTST